MGPPVSLSDKLVKKSSLFVNPAGEQEEPGLNGMIANAINFSVSSIE
jgi:hypothetical protein